MKARPRYAENRVAEELNKIFLPLGYEKFVRIPTTGRTGPDLSINKTNLVIDVKSRLSWPEKYFQPDNYNQDRGEFRLIKRSDHYIISLRYLHYLKETTPIKEQHWQSSAVAKWLDHMHKWTVENMPDTGISALVIHKPGMPYCDARFVFYYSDIGKIIALWRKEK